MVTKVTKNVVADETLTTAQLGPASVGSSELGNNAVAVANLQDRVVSRLKIALLAVSAAEIDDLTITGGKIANTAIIERHYSTASIPQAALKKPSVGTPELVTDSVTADILAELAVGSGHIQPGAVGPSHLAPGAISDPVIDVDSISLSKLKKSATNGSVVYTDATGDKVWKELAAPALAAPHVLTYTPAEGKPHWSPAAVLPGVVLDYLGLACPSGWVFANGKTIGDAASGATGRANNDSLALFTLLWESGFTVTPSKGSTAAADWAAHKAVVLPDLRARTTIGRDAMDNSTSARLPLSLVTNSKAVDAIGAVGGDAQFKMTVAMLPAHKHFMFQSNIVYDNSAPNASPTQHVAHARLGDTGGASYRMGGELGNPEPSVVPTSTTGSGSAVDGIDHMNMPPFATVSKIIKL